ncbi:MAG: M23 family metallopeptidase, partial [Acidimicrobiia bacterium]|nr:M23 family metallopeptidase [Acidimicrobiia bacterium]
QTIDGLDALTERMERATLRAERRMNAGWDDLASIAVDTASLNRLERALATTRVAASDVLGLLIGPTSTGAVPAAISVALFDEDMNFVERRDLTDTLAAWNRFRHAVADAQDLRNVLRERLALPSVIGLRICPLETIDAFRQDWGDPRGWRIHKGTDLNAERGARLVAMERGVVIQTGWHWLGGNQVYLLGAVTGDVYYYAHMDAYAEGIEVGTPVVAGQLIGYVGDTGNADVPHLHLGWMPAAGRVDLDALDDPYPMLVELCL